MDHILDTQNSGTPSVTQDPTLEEGAEAKTIDEVEAERKTAITESIKNFKEAKTAKEELNYHKKLNSVMRNPDSLIDINSDSPELADKIAQEVYGKPYQQLINEANGKKSDVDVNTLVDQRLNDIRKNEEKIKIDSFEDRFFTEKNIVAGSEEYQKIIRIYNKYSPDTLEKATDLMEMAYIKVKGTNNTVTMTNTPPTPSSAPASTLKKKDNKPKPSDEQVALMQTLGVSTEDFEKFSK